MKEFGCEKEFFPMVSIVVPVYNGSNYIREAVDSALAQTYPNIEIIVVNDGSCDNGATNEIVQAYGDRVRYFRKENGGVSTALNMAIQNMEGEYFSWLSHDDVYTPDKIEKSVAALGKNADKHMLVSCETMHIDKDSKPIQLLKKVERRMESEVVAWDEMLMQTLRKGTLNGCALLIHKSVFENCGLFDEQLRFNQDGLMWMKIFLKHYSVLKIPDICVKSRVHENQLTQRGQAIFHSDCEKMSEFLIPELFSCSNKEKNFLLAYIKYNARYANFTVVKSAIPILQMMDFVTLKDLVGVHIICMYGKLRPAIRRLYYRFIKRIKTT